MANDNSNVTWKTIKAYTEKFKNWVANNFNTSTPHIDETTKNWFIGDVDTGILAEGTNGTKGTTYTPIITENGELAWENDGDLPNPTTTPIQTMISTAPLGTVLSFAGSKAPNGYLLCNGASYKVADYPDLYAVIGNTYGGDTENFNVPNLVDKFIEGSTTSGTEKEAGLPNITGTFYHDTNATSSLSGAFFSYTRGSSQNLKNDDAVKSSGYISFDASKSNPIYGKSTTVQPPALTMVYIIKAFHTNEGVDSGVSDDVINYIETELVDLGGREQSVTFPFTPTANGTLILTIGQKSIDPVSRAVNVIYNGEPFYYVNNYFGTSWGVSSTSIPLFKGKTYTVDDPDDAIMYEKTKFIY